MTPLADICLPLAFVIRLKGDVLNKQPLLTLWEDVFAYRIRASPSVKYGPHGGLNIRRGAN
jgi:hypothetical protein